MLFELFEFFPAIKHFSEAAYVRIKLQSQSTSLKSCLQKKWTPEATVNCEVLSVEQLFKHRHSFFPTGYYAVNPYFLLQIFHNFISTLRHKTWRQQVLAGNMRWANSCSEQINKKTLWSNPQESVRHMEFTPGWQSQDWNLQQCYQHKPLTSSAG